MPTTSSGARPVKVRYVSDPRCERCDARDAAWSPSRLDYFAAAALSGLPQAYLGRDPRDVAAFAVRVARAAIEAIENCDDA